MARQTRAAHCNGSSGKVHFDAHGLCDVRTFNCTVPRKIPDAIQSDLAPVLIGSTKMDSKKSGGKLKLILGLLLIFSLWSASSAKETATSDLQRSKEANCLIQGYHTCLLNLLSSNNSLTTSTPSSKASHAPSAHNSSNAGDCLRLSRTQPAASPNRSSPILCGPNECPWDGACLKSGLYNENDGNHYEIKFRNL